ncbi:hypothetical protein SAMN05192564_104219 [Paraburkholderia sartisoli]|uniref:Uncharacterized protein n=1 Tax=Paraburkholderia sartisoli TaxID=83784 RepID=A0A1H4FBS9_9BURK|nr:hypothetical protein SAMN05192564_104219 [Paraburkholderia sartisoli]
MKLAHAFRKNPADAHGASLDVRLEPHFNHVDVGTLLTSCAWRARSWVASKGLYRAGR